MSQLDETKRQLDQVRNSLEEERRQRTAIQADLDKTRADLQRTQDALTSKEKELAEANARASTYMYGIVGVAAVAAVLVASTLLFGRRKSAVITVPKPS
jgi:chromosome segregation ATPase